MKSAVVPYITTHLMFSPVYRGTSGMVGVMIVVDGFSGVVVVVLGLVIMVVVLMV